MKHFFLTETNWKTVQNMEYELAILPWGATEPHNYHLPYGTDYFQSKTISELSAEKAWEKGAKVMVLPTIPLGVQNPGQIELPFCLHTRPTTQKMILEDILTSLNLQGIKKLLIVNGHGGNDFKAMIRELVPQFPSMFIGVTDWYKILENEKYFDEVGDHAGEMETSIMQHLFPELVLPLEEAGEGKANKFSIEALNNREVWTPRNWERISKDTGIGNPKKATAEKGKRFIEDVTAKLTEVMVDISNTEIEELYVSH
ncbi:Creatinine amidohydrolase [hydrothermal vent metagenome]|uniref:Creatinine amidohydrolase n=1 Tax=hydrothermal vent metagenome TaxID=652676 RepID=A0A3B1CF90_9ZZZZ